MPATKKFLDANGVTYLAALLDNYPDNELLGTVISAIQDALDEKLDADISSLTLGNTTITETQLQTLLSFVPALGVSF